MIEVLYLSEHATLKSCWMVLTYIVIHIVTDKRWPTALVIVVNDINRYVDTNYTITNIVSSNSNATVINIHIVHALLHTKEN